MKTRSAVKPYVEGERICEATNILSSDLAGPVKARRHLAQLRSWFGRPSWDMESADAEAYFGRVLRDTANGTQLARSQLLKTYFCFWRSGTRPRSIS